MSPFILAIVLLAMYARNMAPRISFFTRSYGIYFFILITLAVMTTGIQYTPFPRIDSFLVGMDQTLGFNTISLVNWTYAHPVISKASHIAYETLGFQLFLIPLLLAALQSKKSLTILFYAMIISFLIGMTFYYFFPTTGPASLFHDVHFARYQHDTLLKYYQVHHYLPVTTTQGGMIAFPSFHVIWAVLLTYALVDKKWFFYPFVLINTIVIASTLLLGWHYLTDVIGGVALAGLAIFVGRRIYTRSKDYFTIFNFGLPFGKRGDFEPDEESAPPSSSSSANTMPLPFSKL